MDYSVISDAADWSGAVSEVAVVAAAVALVVVAITGAKYVIRMMRG